MRAFEPFHERESLVVSCHVDAFGILLASVCEAHDDVFGPYAHANHGDHDHGHDDEDDEDGVRVDSEELYEHVYTQECGLEEVFVFVFENA